MATITIPGMFLDGDHASRPAASAVGKGSLYACSDHDLIYQSDGSSWSTWSDVSGAGSSTAIPGWVDEFIGTTGTNDIYWDGNDLASFTTQTVTGSAAWTEAHNLVSVAVSNQTSEDDAAILIAKTINTGDAWIVGVNSNILASDSGGTTTGNASAGILFTDGTGTTANCVIGHIQNAWNDSSAPLLVGRHGTLTNHATAPWVSQVQGRGFGGWLYIKLTYQASNTFRVEFGTQGYDGLFHAFGESDISKTMTPTHVGLTGWAVNPGTAVATFGPLRKAF